MLLLMPAQTMHSVCPCVSWPRICLRKSVKIVKRDWR